MTWWTATSVTVTNGGTVVSVNTGDDIQIAQEAGGLIIGNNPPVEIKRTYLDGTSAKKIELRQPWPYGNQSAQPALAFPTDADLAEATRVLREVASDFDAQPNGSTVALRTSNGRLKVTNATESNDAVALGQAVTLTGNQTVVGNTTFSGAIRASNNLAVGLASNPLSRLEVGFESGGSIPDLGVAATGSGVVIGNASGGNLIYGTTINTLSSGAGYIQQQRNDGNATSYSLLLQPRGGQVGIGTPVAGIPTDSKLLVTENKQSGGIVYATVQNSAAGSFATPNQMGVLFKGSSNNNKASITALEQQQSTWDSALVFSTNNVGTTTLSERMRITSQGDVGVGVTPMNISSFTSFDVGGVSPIIKLIPASTNTSSRNWSMGCNLSTFGDFVIKTSDARNGNPVSSSTSSERLIIRPNGSILAPATTSSTDTTAHRLLKVGDFGIGATSSPILNNDIMQSFSDLPSGIYRSGESVAGVPAANAFIALKWNSVNAMAKIYAAVGGTENKAWIQTGNNLPSEVWHAGNLEKTTSQTDTTAGRMLKVGDFGIGSSSLLPVNTNLADTLSQGFHGVNSTTVLNRPTSSLGTLLVANYAAPGLPRASQIYYPVNTPDSYIRINSGGGWSEWCMQYSQNNIVGAVSQSGGVPTGAIIQRGSNTSGEFVRFADGTQICWRQFSTVSVPANATSGAVTWTYPASFIMRPTVNVTSSVNFSEHVDTLIAFTDAGTADSLTQTRVIFRSFATAARDVVGRAIAIGRWY